MEETKVASKNSEDSKIELVEKKEANKESSKESTKKESSKKSKSSKNDKKTSKVAGFFTGVKAEFSKIMWPSKDDIVKQTTAVVVVSFISCALIAGLDIAFEYGINTLINLFK